MIVVADTSPIGYLIPIGQIEILPRLYAGIAIPPTVLGELKHPSGPEQVLAWAACPPNWLNVHTPKSIAAIAKLDPGETAAIALAVEMRAEVLLIDEQAGRQEAARRGLKVAGTLSILDEADREGFANFDAAVNRLLETSFRLSRAVLSEIRERRSYSYHPK